MDRRTRRGQTCENCGGPKHLQCDLCHPHCYFRCAGPLTMYLHRWFLADPVGPNNVQGWQSQYLSVCEAHALSGVFLQGQHGKRESWEEVRSQIEA